MGSSLNRGRACPVCAFPRPMDLGRRVGWILGTRLLEQSTTTSAFLHLVSKVPEHWAQYPRPRHSPCFLLSVTARDCRSMLFQIPRLPIFHYLASFLIQETHLSLEGSASGSPGRRHRVDRSRPSRRPPPSRSHDGKEAKPDSKGARPVPAALASPPQTLIHSTRITP